MFCINVCHGVYTVTVGCKWKAVQVVGFVENPIQCVSGFRDPVVSKPQDDPPSFVMQ